MYKLTALLATSLAALPLIAAAQTVNAPGGQAATALPPDVTAPTNGSTMTKPSTRSKKTSRSNSNSTGRNTAPGINADTAVSNGPNVANTGQTQPRSNTPDTPTRKAE